LKKQKGPNPPWIERWTKRKKMRKNGKEDAVRSFIIFIISSTVSLVGTLFNKE